MGKEHPPDAGRHRVLDVGLPVAPSLEVLGDAAPAPSPTALVDRRTFVLSLVSLGLGVAGAGASIALMWLIALITNLAYFQRLSVGSSAPAANQLGLWAVFVPVLGAIVVGMMARYGSKAIRGHGIPEAMEQVLTNESRIPARLTFLKPVSAAVSIGTGGPFGAEGPIIATGGALGSVAGQVMRMSAMERKTLLAAGAAAGMSATFGTPLAAVLLAVELLLYEYRARSIIPVALAAATAAGVRIVLEGSAPVFDMPTLGAPTFRALIVCAAMGVAFGVAAAGVTRLVYWVEELFGRLPIHWMWWPAIGAVVVGVVGFVAPDTLGVGYYNIVNVLSNTEASQAVLFLCIMKLLSWSVALGSGTSGGTLAPLLTIGGGAGALFGMAVNVYIPSLGVDPSMAALVGMGALFAGATRAVLASIVFAFEATHQTAGLLPLIAGCTTSYLVSCVIMRHTIMTHKIAQRGVRTPAEYVSDALDRVCVRDVATKIVVVLSAHDQVAEARQWIATGTPESAHQGFPIVDGNGVLVGVLTRRDIFHGEVGEKTRLGELIHLPPKFVYEDNSVRQAADHMARHGIGRLPVISRDKSSRIVGIISRSDIIRCFKRDLDEHELAAPTILLGLKKRRTSRSTAS